MRNKPMRTALQEESYPAADMARGNRVMIPVLTAGFTWIGVVLWVVTEDRRLRSDVLAYAPFDLRIWGTIFLAVGLTLLVSIFTVAGWSMRYALNVGAVASFTWGLIVAVAYIRGDASPTSPVWPMIVGFTCIASDLSLVHKKKPRR